MNTHDRHSESDRFGDLRRTTTESLGKHLGRTAGVERSCPVELLQRSGFAHLASGIDQSNRIPTKNGLKTGLEDAPLNREPRYVARSKYESWVASSLVTMPGRPGGIVWDQSKIVKAILHNGFLRFTLMGIEQIKLLTLQAPTVWSSYCVNPFIFPTTIFYLL